MPLPAVLVILGTAATITLAAFGPAYRYAKDVPVQRQENGKSLDRALRKAATEGKYRDYIRSIEAKPYSAIRGYYEIKVGKSTQYIVIYENGTIAEKSDGSDWIRHTSPEALNKFYSQLRSHLEETPSYKQKRLMDLVDSEIERLLL